MHTGGMVFNGETIETQSLGGSETAAYYLAKELKSKGHRVTMFTNGEGGNFDGVEYVNSGTPSEQNPLGEVFHFYATNTPHDVLIIQRHPLAFNTQYASKLNFLWLHDVPNKDQIGLFNSQMWNISGVLTVSEYHKAIVVDAYKIDPEFVFSIENGVDGALYKDATLERNPTHYVLEPNKFNMIYSSRPERGLEHLVGEGGIMEVLAKENTDHHLYVCGYDNVTQQMAQYYDYLNQRIEQLPNVTNVGSLTKQQLANLQLNCDLAIYPTEFEEVSCITAMECMHAGLPLLTSNHAALKETCKGSGTILLDLKKGKVVHSKFIGTLKAINKDLLTPHRIKQKASSQVHTWDLVSKRLLGVISNKFSDASIESKAKHLMRNGDIFALKFLLDSTKKKSAILDDLRIELGLYDFAFNDTFAEHYKGYYEYEKERGVDYGAEDLTGNQRFEFVSSKIAELYKQWPHEHNMRVLDYGCAHGHYTVNLAKRFPGIDFLGVDIAASNIEKAVAWTLQEGLGNAKFINGAVDVSTGLLASEGQQKDINTLEFFDIIIAAEVIEHVATPIEHVSVLNTYLSDNGTMILTTPYGTWEYIAVREHHPWRAHIHHFERDDLTEVFGKCDDFKIAAIPSGQDKYGNVLGSYVTTFAKFSHELGGIDYKRKIKQTIGRETISLCMIVKNGETTLRRTLDSVSCVIDELIIGVDKTTTDRTVSVIYDFIEANPTGVALKVIDIDSPIESGFAVARNTTIKQASGDWIMWLDADEILDREQALIRYMRPNQHRGFAIEQHHFSVEPAGILKTDLPTRIFRNNKKVEFHGVVHEHPETTMNHGIPFCSKVKGTSIAHYGYQNEEIRRKRFERNIPLMIRDRKINPTRLLGKFLWIRDLSQMCMFEIEQTGRPSQAIHERAREGVTVWRELLSVKNMRLVIDSLEYVSSLNRILSDGGGKEFKFKMLSDDFGKVDLNNAREVSAFFNDKQDAEKLFKLLVDESLKTLKG
jgi:2-polyprenyl-3-methyl-5-hydroxy-6-metoxy-1,4-benzoquinol methylase/glycosyltransferase involved in cell wall biosynthesis